MTYGNASLIMHKKLSRRQLVMSDAEDLGPVIKQLLLKIYFYGAKVNFEGSELFVIFKDR